jgi:hypothetical protein
MTAVVANTNEDLAIPYSNKKQILSAYEKIHSRNQRLDKNKDLTKNKVHKYLTGFEDLLG